MGFLSRLFHSRDKLANSTNGSDYRFLFGESNFSKAVNERSAMQMWRHLQTQDTHLQHIQVCRMGLQHSPEK